MLVHIARTYKWSMVLTLLTLLANTALAETTSCIICSATQGSERSENRQLSAPCNDTTDLFSKESCRPLFLRATEKSAGGFFALENQPGESVSEEPPQAETPGSVVPS